MGRPMEKIMNFLFRTNVSLDSYRTKDEAFACISSTKKAKEIGRERMAFKDRTVTTTDFLRLATSGYCFCNLFDYDPKIPKKVKKNNRWLDVSPVYTKGNNKGGMKTFVKRDAYFKGAQTVFVDIDYTLYQEIPDYLSTLSIPPTCVYMSFSDNKDKGGRRSRRFRMVYVFDKVLEKQEFIGISHLISNRIVAETGEEMDDDCGTRMSQYMNGVYGNRETYCSDIIYSIADFPGWEDAAASEDTNIEFDDYMCWQMESLSYEDFMHTNSWRGYYYRTEKPDWIDGIYQLTDENYLAVWFPRDIVKDGHKRRKKLYMNACLRALMFPGIDPNTLLFNLYVDTARFFDNSDGVITLDGLKRRAKKALRMTKDELRTECQWYIDYWKENRPRFIVRSGIRMTQGKQQYISKLIHWKELDATYDRTKTVQQNLEMGINASESTLYRYCSERGIATNPAKGMTKAEKREATRALKEEKIEKFKSLYNPALSIRRNMMIMEQHKLSLSLGTVNNWIDSYCTETTVPTIDEDTVESIINFGDFVVGYDVPDFCKTGISIPQPLIPEVPDIIPDYGNINIGFTIPAFNNRFYYVV